MVHTRLALADYQSRPRLAMDPKKITRAEHRISIQTPTKPYRKVARAINQIVTTHFMKKGLIIKICCAILGII